MTEHEAIYQALSSPFGLVVTGTLARLRSAQRTLAEHDPLVRELRVLGPDARGQIFLLRATDELRAEMKLAEQLAHDKRNSNGGHQE